MAHRCGAVGADFFGAGALRAGCVPAVYVLHNWTTSPVWRSCAPAPRDDRAQPLLVVEAVLPADDSPLSRKLLDL